MVSRLFGDSSPHRVARTHADRPLHIVHLIDALGPGGAERLLYTNLKHFDPTRVRSTVLTLFPQPDYWQEAIGQLGVEVVCLYCNSRSDLLAGTARLWSWLRKEQPDLVHTHLWAANVIGRMAARLSGLPAISSIHGLDYEPEAWNDGSAMSLRKRKLIRALDRWTARFGCKRILAVSEYVRQSASHHLRFPLDQTELLYNPIDLDEFRESPRDSRAEILRELELPAECFLLLSVGHIYPPKGLLYAIRALPTIVERYPSAHLVSAGAITSSQWLARLQDEIVSLGLEKHVHILGPRRDIPELLRACDLFVFPSLHEGLGIALIEAMASGCACVATTAGPIPEIVRHSIDGWLVPAADSESLAEAVCALLADPARREALGQAAKTSALARFQPQVAADRLMEIYKSVLAIRGSQLSLNG